MSSNRDSVISTDLFRGKSKTSLDLLDDIELRQSHIDLRKGVVGKEGRSAKSDLQKLLIFVNGLKTR
jgi:hypothetical protein